MIPLIDVINSEFVVHTLNCMVGNTRQREGTGGSTSR